MVQDHARDSIHGGDARKMTAINEAWATLGDRGKRARYDAKFRRESVVAAAAAANAAARPAPQPVMRPNPNPAPSTAGPSAPPRPSGAFAQPTAADVLDFGRYAGWSLMDLGRHDPDYLLWLERTPIGRSYRGEIQRVLESQPGTPVATATRAATSNSGSRVGRWFR